MGVVRPPPDRPIWGWPNHPHGPRGASHPLWGGSATPIFFFFFFFIFFFIDLKGWPGHPFKSMKKKKKKIGVAEPPHRGWLAALWAMGVVRPPPDRPIWGWPNHPHGPRGGQPPPWGWFGHPSFFSFFF
jgi:hypothetical protein